MKLKNYDYFLVVLTTAILFAIGIVCVYGITYYNYLASVPGWTETARYLQFINDMNSYLYPFLVLLLISLGLCIPKRLFEQDILVKISALALAVTVILTYSLGMETAVGFILAVITGIQGIVLILTFKKSRAVRFEKEGHIARIGSSMLHLGIVVLIFNFVTLRENQLHIMIFWAGTILVTAGNLFSFFPGRVGSLLKR
ncbi:MAG: hypothetical protein PHH85_09325 [Candidatus Methanoperedens sp.]|nr:hypothetical protein [Candidatus Methanoperedens sp.]